MGTGHEESGKHSFRYKTAETQERRHQSSYLEPQADSQSQQAVHEHSSDDVGVQPGGQGRTYSALARSSCHRERRSIPFPHICSNDKGSCNTLGCRPQNNVPCRSSQACKRQQPTHVLRRLGSRYSRGHRWNVCRRPRRSYMAPGEAGVNRRRQYIFQRALSWSRVGDRFYSVPRRG